MAQQTRPRTLLPGDARTNDRDPTYQVPYTYRTATATRRAVRFL